MKRLTTFLLAAACTLVAAAQTRITDLRVQNSHEPIAVEDRQPDFGWRMESDRRGIESHGCNRFKPIYLDRIKSGTLLPVTEIEIPSSVSAIGSLTFKGCTGLRKIVIPPSVKKFGSWIFNGCDDLTVYGTAGSAAEQYAKEHDIPFVAQ